MQLRTFVLRIIGFILSLILTFGAYFIMIHSDRFDLTTGMAVSVIIILAVVQSIVQLIFFLLWREKGTNWNLNFFLSTVSIIFIVIFFSIWIMNHLNYNMMLP